MQVQVLTLVSSAVSEGDGLQAVERPGSQLSRSGFESRRRRQVLGVVAERIRHLIVDQDYASSNLVDPADV
jgi:hypothetical protein